MGLPDFRRRQTLVSNPVPSRASLHGPLTPIERHDGCEFTSIVQEEQVIGLLPLVVAFFAKYSVHSDDQLDRHLRS